MSQTFVRTREEIRRSGYDHFNLILDLGGPVIADYDGRAVNSRAGGLRFMDTTRELRATIEALQMLIFIVPRARMSQRLLSLDMHGLSLDADLGVTRLLARHILGLFDDAESLSQAEADAALDATLTMVESALDRAPELNLDKASGVHRTVRGAAKSYIDVRLGQRELEPAQIAKAIGVSRSVLYRAFDSYGGVAAYVMTRRLDVAFEALLRRRGRTPTISDIAYAHGFVSDAHFSRAFRARFGMSPREVEERPGGPDGATLSFDEPPGAPLGLHWMRAL